MAELWLCATGEKFKVVVNEPFDVGWWTPFIQFTYRGRFISIQQVQLKTNVYDIFSEEEDAMETFLMGKDLSIVRKDGDGHLACRIWACLSST